MNHWIRHSITCLLAAMISTASLAQSKETLDTWVQLSDLSAPAQDFLMDGKTRRSLADFKGQVVLLNLWATWCTPCLKELPTLDALEEKYAANGLVVLPVSVDALPYVQLRGFVEKQKLQLPHLAQDDTASFSKTLVGRGLPVTYLIDRHGVLRARYSGGADWLAPEHTARIEAMLAEK